MDQARRSARDPPFCLRPRPRPPDERLSPKMGSTERSAFNAGGISNDMKSMTRATVIPHLLVCLALCWLLTVGGNVCYGRSRLSASEVVR